MPIAAKSDHDPFAECPGAASHGLPTLSQMTTIRVSKRSPPSEARRRTPGLVVMKFGGTSVGDTDKLKRVARAARRRPRVGREGRRRPLRDGPDDRRADPPRARGLAARRIRASTTCSSRPASGSRTRSARWRSTTSATRPSRSPARRPGSSPTAATPRRRSSRCARSGSTTRSSEDKIVLVAGFQGVSTSTHDVTTLGRGGSDTTAVALAAALGADACEIFTDVAGVFTADPRIVPDALKLDRVTYEEMLEMSASGAKVMALRSIEVARSYGVKLRVRSTFVDGEGTWIGEEDEAVLEKAIISGVTHDTSEAKVVDRRRARPARGSRRGSSATLADAGVNIDMIVQNVSRGRHDEHHLHAAEDRSADRRADPRRARCRDRRRRRRARPRHRQDLADRRGHEEPSGRRRRHVRRARRGGHQHRDHLDVVDPRSRASSAPPRSSARCAPSTTRFRTSPRSASMAERRASASSARPAPSAPSRSACSRERGYDERARLRVARARPASSSAGCTVEEATPEALARGDVDIFLFSVGTRRLARARAARRARRRGRDRQVVGLPARAGHPARRARGERASRALEHDGIVANPNCCTIPLTCVLKPLHDAAGPRARARRDVPVGLGRRRAGDGAAARTRRRPSTTCAWTGTSTARSSTRSRSSATRRARSWSCPTCRSRRRASACR